MKKNNYGMSKSLYWRLPTQIRRNIKSEFDAFAVWFHEPVMNGRQSRKAARKAGYKNWRDAMQKLGHPNQ